MKVECELEDVFTVTKEKLQNEGLLLTSAGLNGQYNVMTIGWGLIGRLWGELVFMVAVRPSRHTFKLLEETNEFTVNIPADGMKDVTAYCGKVSGRDYDKIEEMKLTIREGGKVKSPILEKCIAHLECKIVGKAQLSPDLLSREIQHRSYSSGNYHLLYFGRLLSILKDNTWEYG